MLAYAAESLHEPPAPQTVPAEAAAAEEEAAAASEYSHVPRAACYERM
jgi:hypothetical protein